MFQVPRITASAAEIEAALAVADIPVLQMVLFHLTGERRWLEPPFTPVRDVSQFADESGGLPPLVQQVVREAAFAALGDYHAGRLEPQPLPSHEVFAEMMSVCVGERVPVEYVPMMLEEMGLKDRDPAWTVPASTTATRGFEVLIIGAGVSGICLGSKLQAAGVKYTILEKNPALGGTWYENKYPECGCDVPNHFYSFSNRPNAEWSGYYSKADEIEAYLHDSAEAFGVVPNIRFSTEVLGARWDETAAHWAVTVKHADGTQEVLHTPVLVSATGQLNRPSVPDLEGLDSFAGPAFHTARWPRDLDLSGKRVAVIGTGASAMQMARTTAQVAEHLSIFQRSPQWAVPSDTYHRLVSDDKRWLFRHVPFYLGWYRFSLAWRFGDHLLRTLERDEQWPHPERAVNSRNDRHRERLTAYLQAELADRPDLIEKSLPDYPPYAKRILIDNEWFKTIKRDNVSLVTTAIARITPTGVTTTDGAEHPADVLVLATGFEAMRLLWPMDIRGVGGRSLHEVWGDEDAAAYLGITVPGFPNFFCLYGPNTNLAHGGSIILIAECQSRYVMACLQRMLGEDLAAIDCKPEVFRDYNARIDAAHAKLVWTSPTVNNWYRNKAGRVVSVMPMRLVDYWRETLAPNPADFIETRRAG